jgi:CheY-like chemotaxis protein
VQTLASQRSVVLEAILPEQRTGVAVHPVALNELLLNALTVAIHRASGGSVRVTSETSVPEVHVRIVGASQSGLTQASTDDTTSLDIARQVAALSGGAFGVADSETAFEALLTLPLIEQILVLAVDDNTDALQLLERYAVGTRYRVRGTADPSQLLLLAAELAPQIIVLDVMMPQIDGWKLLGQIREHPLTGQTPVVVCTILAQKELASTLGAAAFVKKPVKRQAFLSALDRAYEKERGSG